MAVSGIEYSAAGVALLPVLEPDVVKLDHTSMQQSGAALLGALNEGELNGAALLVERAEHHDATINARAIGATYQQGHLLGMPGPLPTRLPPPHAPMTITEFELPEQTPTPWEALRDLGAKRVSNVDQTGLDQLIATATARATALDPAPMVAVVTQEGDTMPAARRQPFRMMLERSPLIVALGRHVTSWSDWRVRTAELPDGHSLRREACFVMLSPGASMVVAARAHGSPNAKAAALWDVAVTQNQEWSRSVVRALLHHVDTLEGGVHSHL